MTDIDKQLREEFERVAYDDEQDYEKTVDRMFDWILFKLSQAKEEQREETAKEIIEMIEKDESDYDFGDDYSIAKYNMVKLIKSKYGIGEK